MGEKNEVSATVDGYGCRKQLWRRSTSLGSSIAACLDVKRRSRKSATQRGVKKEGIGGMRFE